MTDDFDFDFDLSRGRSGSPTQSNGSGEPADDAGDVELPERDLGSERTADRGNAKPPRRNGKSRNGGTRRRRQNGAGEGSTPAQTPQDPDDWLGLTDAPEGGDLESLAKPDDGPAGPPTPHEARNFAKEARRRASRRPSPLLDLNGETEAAPDANEDNEPIDFESVLKRQPQKSGVARRTWRRFRRRSALAAGSGRKGGPAAAPSGGGVTRADGGATQ